MIGKEEFRKKVIAKAILKLHIPINNWNLKQNLKDYSEKDRCIILYQTSERNYRVDCFNEQQFKKFTQAHYHSWWVLREGEFSAVSPLSHLLHENTLKARGVL